MTKNLSLNRLRSSASIMLDKCVNGIGLKRPLKPINGRIQMRLAKLTDIPSIDRCNLASLPENYSHQFYENQLHQWPELTIVAEHIHGDSFQEDDTKRFVDCPQEQPNSNIVAYVLGRVEQRQTATEYPLGKCVPVPSEADLAEEVVQQESPISPEKIGFVMSIAVMGDYRERGLAKNLMNQLHWHLTQCHGSTGIGLYVRTSNVDALYLYQRAGYEVVGVLPRYYGDGEDAYFMKKHLSEKSTVNNNNLGTLQQSHPWQSGPLPWRLPRTIYNEKL